jgi:hypothetical protein
LFWLFALTAHADVSDYISEISDPIIYDVNGIWVRTFYTDTGWKLLAQQGESYTVTDLTKEGGTWVRSAEVTRLTEGRDYKDSCIKRCPNNDYLLISSANTTGYNDSAYAFRFDEDFNLLSQSVIAESESQYSFNDVNCECSEFIQGATFGLNHPTQYANYFFPLTDNLSPDGEPFLISEITRANGGATWSDLSTNRVIMSGFHNESQNYFIEFDPELSLINQSPTQMSEPPWQDFWTQSFIRVGEVFFAATIVRESVDSNIPYEIILVVLDEEWTVLERHQVTIGGGSRPSLTRNGDQLLLTCDVNNSPQLIEITLGTGFNSEDPPPLGYTDSYDTGAASKERGCGGCSSQTNGGAFSILFVVLGLGYRRCDTSIFAHKH